MKTIIQSPTKRLMSTAGLIVATAMPLMAQNPPFPMPGAGGQGPGQAAPAKRVTAENSNASRFVGPEELTEYISKYAATFSMKGRKADPFGQVQDPTQPPPKTTSTIRRPTRTLRKTAFDDIVSRIKINAVMPAENRFMTRNRSFKLGDRFPLRYKGGKEFQVEVVAVTAKQVDFKKVETGEIASVKLGVKPPGMTSGIKGITTPGMQSDNPNATLSIDPLSEF